jgi:hypothetical protein
MVLLVAVGGNTVPLKVRGCSVVPLAGPVKVSSATGTNPMVMSKSWVKDVPTAVPLATVAVTVTVPFPVVESVFPLSVAPADCVKTIAAAAATW